MSWASNNVSSRDYSWSASASIVTPKFPPPCCICKRPCVISTSRTLKNPNRPFYGCPLYKEKKPHCGTFVWVDIYEAQMEQERLKEMEMEMEMGDGRIPQVEMEITEMKAKMNEMQVKMLIISKDVVYIQRSFGVVIGVVLVFVVMVMIFYVWK